MTCCQAVCGFTGSSWMCWSVEARLNLTPLVIICGTPDTGSVTFLGYVQRERERNRWRSEAVRGGWEREDNDSDNIFKNF